MGALDELADLTETARDVPPHRGPELFRSVRRRRTRRRQAGATLATVAVAMVAVVVWPGGDLPDRVVIDEIAGADGHVSGALPVPDRGSASAGYLDDGTPVFVSHANDGTVRVLDALDPHLDGKLIAYCPQVDRLLEPRAGSTYLLDGTWTGGPSPADLSRYPAETTDDGARVVVSGPVEASEGRSAEQRDFTGMRCDDVVMHDPDRSEPDLPVREAVPDDGSWGWAYVRLEVFDDRSLILCDALRGCPRRQDGLPTGAQLPAANDPADFPDTTMLWALVHNGTDGVDVRYAVRDIDINTGPRTGLDAVRSSIGSSPRHLVQATDEAGDGLDADRLLRLRFDPDGWFSADLPCTTRYGRYELDADDAIRFHDVQSTPAGTCDSQQLQDVLQTVLDDGARTLQVEGNDLRLTAPQGHRLDYSWN